MNSLMKIREVSTRYDITARTLRYYEDMGLIKSIRADETAYRMYDENEVRRIEQILILRKLNISIKDIKRIFETSGSEVVLEVLAKKAENIDDEIALLSQLKEIVMEFIQEIETLNFMDNSDIKELYDKAKEIEKHIINVDYDGKSSTVSRLIEVTSKLDKKIPDIMVVRVPSFKGITTGVHSWEEIFSEGGYMFRLWQHYSLFRPIIFDCLDFTMVVDDNRGEMICAVSDDVQKESVSPMELIDFEGGLYAMAVSIDEDDESIIKVQEKIFKWLENTNFDVDKDRKFMFNMPYLDESNEYQQDIEKGLGYRQMQRYVPIKLKEGK